MIALLFDGEKVASEQSQNNSGLLFYNAKVGDVVCVVNDLTRSFEIDSVLDIFFSQDTRREKFIHLKKSKMIVSEKDRHILYPKDSARKLEHVLGTLSNASNKDWVIQIPALLKGESSPLTVPPVPCN